MHRHIFGKRVPAFLETDDMDFFRMLREFLYPAMEKGEHGVIEIDRLRRDKEPHGLILARFPPSALHDLWTVDAGEELQILFRTFQELDVLFFESPERIEGFLVFRQDFLIEHAQRREVLDKAPAASAATAFVHRLRVAIRDIRVGEQRLMDHAPISTEFPGKVIEDVEGDDLRVAAHVVRILDDLGFGRRGYEREWRLGKNGENRLCGLPMSDVILRKSDNVRERMRRVVRE